MNDIKFNPPGYYMDSMYAVDRDKESIIIGTDLEKLSKKMFETHKHHVKESLRMFNSLTELAQEKPERSLIHESIHIVLHSLEGWQTCLDFENVDHNYEISELDPET